MRAKLTIQNSTGVYLYSNVDQLYKAATGGTNDPLILKIGTENKLVRSYSAFAGHLQGIESCEMTCYYGKYQLTKVKAVNLPLPEPPKLKAHYREEDSMFENELK